MSLPVNQRKITWCAPFVNLVESKIWNGIGNWEASEIGEQESDKFKRWIKENIMY